MGLALVIFCILVALALLLVLALGVAAKRADHGDRDTGWLVAVAALRSPSGKPFFANRREMSKLVQAVDEVRDDEDERPR